MVIGFNEVMKNVKGFSGDFSNEVIPAPPNAPVWKIPSSQ